MSPTSDQLQAIESDPDTVESLESLLESCDYEPSEDIFLTLTPNA